MRTFLAVAFAATMLSHTGLQPAAAAVRPWCEYGAMYGWSPDCSFATLAQCLQTARGDGTCVRNPVFDWPYFQRRQLPPADTDVYGRPLRAPRR
jgi:hypothetical protein